MKLKIFFTKELRHSRYAKHALLNFSFKYHFEMNAEASGLIHLAIKLFYKTRPIAMKKTLKNIPKQENKTLFFYWYSHFYGIYILYT